MTNDKTSLKVIGAIISTGILSFCGVLAETAMNVAFPTLIKEFSVNTATVQWLTTIYLLVLSIVVPISGFLKQSFPNKKLFLCSIGVFITGVSIAAVAPNFYVLLAGRAVQGLATGIALPLMFNIIIEQVPRSKLGLMMGVGTMIPAIAPAIGPIFGGVVITQLGWRYIFILLIPILVFALVLGWKTIEQVSPIKPQSIDKMGLLTIALVFIGLIFGFSNFGSHSFFSPSVLLPLLVAVLATVVMVRHAKKYPNPILKLSLLADKTFLLHVISYFIVQLVLMGLVFILPNYLQIVNGLDAQASGMTVFPGAALGALLTPVGGIVLDRLGAKKPIVFGSLTLFTSLLLFWILAGRLTPVVTAVLYFMFTLGIGFSFGNLMTNGLNQLEQTSQADGNAILMTFQQLAGAMGTSIVASVLSLSQSDTSQSLAETTITGSSYGFIFLILLTAIELLSLFFIFKKSPAR